MLRCHMVAKWAGILKTISFAKRDSPVLKYPQLSRWCITLVFKRLIKQKYVNVFSVCHKISSVLLKDKLFTKNMSL